MTRRIALAAVYTLFIGTLLVTWPWSGTQPPIDDPTVIRAIRAIRAIPVARWLVIIMPVYWAWAAFSLETRLARRMMLAGSVALFVACFLFIEQPDPNGPFCLWDSGNCGPGWFN